MAGVAHEEERAEREAGVSGERAQAEGVGVQEALEAIAHLAGEIGPRPPTGEGERQAAEWFAARLEEIGLEPRIEEFPGYRSFGRLYLPIFGLALLSRWARRLPTRLFAGLAAAAIGWWEGEYRSWGRFAGLFPGRSRNVEATIESSGDVERTICLVCHLDSSRSGLMFHPSIAAWLGRLVGAVSAALVGNVLGPLVARLPGPLSLVGRALDCVSGLLLRLGFGLILERELRGRDVPGANDNASGVGACLALARVLGERPLAGSRVVVLATGGEEAGLLGMRHLLDTRDTEDWIFINLDGVGAAAPLRYLRVEGGPLNPRRADPALVELAEAVAAARPELGISGCDHGSGMPYDATAVLARGGRALTITTQGRTIPNYHWPTDLPATIDRAALGRAIEFAQEMVTRIDRGEADRVG